MVLAGAGANGEEPVKVDLSTSTDNINIAFPHKSHKKFYVLH